MPREVVVGDENGVWSLTGSMSSTRVIGACATVGVAPGSGSDAST